MPNVTMCMNDECVMRKECLRYVATPGKYSQSFSFYKPNADGTCEDKIEIQQNAQDEQRKDKK